MNRLATLRYLALPFHAAHDRPGAPILSVEDANPLEGAPAGERAVPSLGP
jgi:hypothetical protein